MGNVFFPACQVVKFNVKIYVSFRCLHFDFISDFPMFLPKSGCSLTKKKKKSLHIDFISDFPIFLPKSGCSLKKKKVRKRVFEKYSRRRVPYKITSRARGCRCEGL